MPAANPWKKDSKAAAAEQTSPSPEPPKGSSGKGPRGRVLRGKQEAAKEAEDSSSSSEQEETNDKHPGRIRNLAKSFTSSSNETKTVRKKRLEVTDTADPIVLENDPVERLEGVVRSNDPGEWEKPIELEKGRTKNMASMFLTKQDDDPKGSKKPFVMDLDQNASVILESEPVQLEGVVRSGDKVKDVICKRGRIKHIAGRFAESGQPLTDEDDDNNEASGGAGTSVWTDTSSQVQVESGKARSMAERFTSRQAGESSSKSSRNGGKPQWMIELENAQDGGVFENEPDAPTEGVARADDEQPDVISVQHTRNLKAMWSQFEKDELTKDGSYQPQRRSDIVVKSKKEPTPESSPEPEPQPTKSRFGANKKFGPSAQNVAVTFDKKDGGKDDKSSSGKKGVKGKKEAEPEPPEPAKDNKGFTKPALKSVNRKF